MHVEGAAAERPILFTGRLVRKLLADEKSQTRRILNPQPVPDPEFLGGVAWKTKRADTAIASINEGCYPEVCPYGKPGDRLWVRESFVTGHRMTGGDLDLYDERGNEKPPTVWYRADDNEHLVWMAEDGESLSTAIPWKPSIHMPRWACRLMLELIGVRVERLNEITEADAKAEGAELAPCDCPDCGHPECGQGCRLTKSYRGAFAFMWNRINADRGSWSDNPYVWVLTFRRLLSAQE